MEHECTGAGCCLKAFIGLIAWWGIASTLLWVTWNQVVGYFVKVKPAKLKHALLLLATVGVLAMPCALFKKSHCGRYSGVGISHCSHCQHCHDKGCDLGLTEKEKEDCPYTHRHKDKAKED